MPGNELDLFQRLGVALVIGLLVGLERGWRQRDLAEGSRVAGIRSFALIGLLGGVLGAVSATAGDTVLAVAFLGFALLVTAAHWLRSHDHNDLGITTEIAELLTFALGVLAVRVDMAAAAAAAVVVVALLGSKEPLHLWLSRMQRLELVATIKLLLISVVLLPVLPNQGFGPGGAVNPQKLWWLVVAIAGLSFLGYFAIKLAGPRLGSLLTGIFGGLASSTALTVSFSRLGRASPDLQSTLAAGVAVAAATMLLRVLLIVGLIQWRLIAPLAWPIGVMAVVGYGGAVLLWAKSGGKDHRPAESTPLSNPFELGTALKFGAFLAGVLILAELAKQWLGKAGLYALAAISALADVDAIAVSMANMARHQTSLQVAATAILIAAAVNTLVKAAVVWVLCGGTMAWRISGLSGAMVASAGAVWWMVR
jgi:uncharacterized membrane protein (DUF4010 family)